MNGGGENGPRGALFGVFLVVVGLGTLLAVGGISAASFGENQDPGPRALPMILAWCLLLGGVAEIVTTAVRRRRLAARETGGRETPARAAGSQLLDAGILLGALIVYIAALPWVGFTLSTLGFSMGMMWRLKTGWWLNLAVSFGLIGAIHVLFVMVFRVQLPAGELGLPF